MSEARRLKRKARRNLHRARVRARKRLENRNPDTRAPVPAHPEPPVRPHCDVSQESDDDCLSFSMILFYLDDPKGSGRYHQTSLSTKEQERKKSVKQLKTNTRRYLKEVWGIMNLIEEKLDVYERLLKHHLQEQEEKVARRVQRLARKQQRLQDRSAARERASLLCCNGLHSQQKSDLIVRRQEKEEATPSQLPPSTHPDTGSRVISLPCEQLSDIDAEIKQAEDLVNEVVKTTLNHINSRLRARTIFRIKKEIMVAMKMDVKFFKDDGPLIPGPLRKKYRAGYVRRFRQNPPPEKELLSDKTARQFASLLNGQPNVQPSSDGGVDLSPRLYPFAAESFLGSSPELIAITAMDSSPTSN
ncbi:hypothetical protein QAD02_020553 [Eretmocerus hayati]|uniref:Uncharacterized protein n=1 Tax=Eretmocerus hayati TaxID=131215 RepID=A0ACC2PMD6_9HYME|nr:hypothetical protein QAD02_020553 [Eretmocerus hayati]